MIEDSGQQNQLTPSICGTDEIKCAQVVLLQKLEKLFALQNLLEFFLGKKKKKKLRLHIFRLKFYRPLNS